MAEPTTPQPESEPADPTPVWDVHKAALQEIDRIVGNETTLDEPDTTRLRGILFAALSERASSAERPHVHRAVDLLADLIVKCTEYGDQDGGFVAAYLLPTGPVHRAIPFLDSVGIPARPGFDPRAKATQPPATG